MASQVRITDKDKGLESALRHIGNLSKGPILSLGVQGSQAAELHKVSPSTPNAKQNATVGEIAAFAELGLGQPERSWLRAWFDAHEEEIKADLKTVAQGVIAEKYTAEKGLELLGLKYQGQIQQRIADGIAPPNALRTIERKGSSTPLIDTGQLRSAITYLLKNR